MNALGMLAVEVLAMFAAAGGDRESGFVPLFDGRSLAGWEGNLSMFRVQDGAIVAGTLKEAIPRNEFLCTKKPFGDFELRVEAKLVGPGNNAGIQFRSQRIPNHHEVSGYQCDMGGAFNRTVWGALYDESRRGKMLAEGDGEKTQQVLKPNDWNEFVIRCQGDRIQIWLNGYRTVDYVEKQKDIARQGILGLQIHGGKPAQASYRNIRIKELKEGT